MRLRAGLLLLLGIAATSVAAQPAATAAPASPRPVVTVADSLANEGDTLQAVELLEAAVRANRRDAAAWHRLGMLRWGMARSHRSPSYIKDQAAIRHLIQADTALRLASQFAPDSARYRLELGRFLLGSGIAITRYASQGQMRRGLEAAELALDSAAIADAADEVGMITWRRYEPIANRVIVKDNMPLRFDREALWRRDRALDYIATIVTFPDPPLGKATYSEAREYFTRAYAADPTNPRVVRHYLMALAERGEWESLRTIARARTLRYPVDHLSFLALGLAEQRLGNGAGAEAAFERALAVMDQDEAARMTRLSRILRPKVPPKRRGSAGTADTRAWEALPEPNRRAVEAMYWLTADPLSLTDANESRNEFLARVAFADLRWTSDDLDLRGADTDRGDIHVRFGPPGLLFTVAGSEVWVYRNGLVFIFSHAPTFGTARIPNGDLDYVEQLRNAMPVSFDNVTVALRLDTIPVQLARFRAPQGDSLDVLIAAAIPMDSLLRTLEVDRAPVAYGIRHFDQYVRVHGVETTDATVMPDTVRGPLERQWIRRVGRGLNLVRVEAFQADARRAARSTVRIDDDATSGFGMSDVLLGSRPAVREGVSAPARWRDVAITPTTGTFAAGSPIGIVWEMYELLSKEGAARYRVAITVERSDRTGVRALAARVVDGVGTALTREARGRDRLTVTFDRTVTGAPTLVDFMSLDLTSSPPGAYRMRIEITDLESRRRIAREAAFRIR